MPKRKPIVNYALKPKSKCSAVNIVSGSMEQCLGEITAIPNDSEHVRATGPQVIRQELDGTFTVVGMDAIFTDDCDDAFGYIIVGINTGRPKRSLN